VRASRSRPALVGSATCILQVAGFSMRGGCGTRTPEGFHPTRLQLLGGGFRVVSCGRLSRSASCEYAAESVWIGSDEVKLPPQPLPVTGCWGAHGDFRRSRDAYRVTIGQWQRDWCARWCEPTHSPSAVHVLRSLQARADSPQSLAAAPARDGSASPLVVRAIARAAALRDGTAPSPRAPCRLNHIDRSARARAPIRRGAPMTPRLSCQLFSWPSRAASRLTAPSRSR